MLAELMPKKPLMRLVRAVLIFLSCLRKRDFLSLCFKRPMKSEIGANYDLGSDVNEPISHGWSLCTPKSCFLAKPLILSSFTLLFCDMTGLKNSLSFTCFLEKKRMQ